MLHAVDVMEVVKLLVPLVAVKVEVTILTVALISVPLAEEAKQNNVPHVTAEET
jgi:hypothetical protein